MEEYKNISNELQRMLYKAEELDWSYTVYEEPCQRNRAYVEMRKYSPAGEDFSMIIDFDSENQAESFLKDLLDYADNFDADDHVEMWISERGKGGCPSTIKELMEDAEAIAEMIKELYRKLDNVQHPELSEKQAVRCDEDKGRKLAEFIIRNFHHCPIPVELVCEFGFGKEGCVDCLLSHVELLKYPREN